MNEKSKFKFKSVNLQSNFNIDITETKNKKWVFFGKDNMAPERILYLSNQTGLHTAILSKKIKLGFGNGLYSPDENQKTRNFLTKCNALNESLQDVAYKCYVDLEIFGGFYLQPLLNSAGQLVELYHMPFSNLRAEKKNKYGFIENWFYSEKWKSYMNSSNLDEIPNFNGKNKKSIYQAAQYNATNAYYPFPSYIGAIKDIDTLANISDFHNANLHNNFQPGAIFILKPGAQATEEEIDLMLDDIENQVGANGTGKIIAIVKDPRDEEPTFEQFKVSDIDKQFDALRKSVEGSIAMAHNATRIVAGLEQPGSLGGSKEHAEANLIFFDDYVKKNQAFFLRKLNALLTPYSFSPLEIENDLRNPFLYDTALLTQNLTKNEIREILGYDPIDEPAASQSTETQQ